jgi:undecaprenyl-diphosphatase
MSFFSAAILGLIQGFTEFLPVSSSGHLVIAQSLLGFDQPPLLFDVMVHGGTLVAVLIYFRKDIAMILNGITKPNAAQTDHHSRRNEGRWFAILVIVGTIPAVIVGAVFKDFLESLFAAPIIVGFMLWITATILFLADRRVRRQKSISDTTLLDAILVGIAQAIAIIPGISRSGFTISMGIFRKMTSDTAARFSFILSIPAIIGAIILQALDVQQLSMDVFWMYLIGTLFAAVSGYLSIALLIRMVKAFKLRAFSIYLWIVGFIVIWANILFEPAA